MKKYIFFTADIHPVGGMQIYIAGKAKYLKKNGWDVYVFFAGSNEKSCAFPSLNEYVHGGRECLRVLPRQITNREINYELTKMLEIIGYVKNDRVYVESNYDKPAIWAELFAEKIMAKHVCLNCNEIFRGKNKYYEKYIDFFWFKYLRKELAGISNNSMALLFNGKFTVDNKPEFVFHAAPDETVQDVINASVSNLKKYDFNICYIGRTEKECFLNITKGVAKFCESYKEYHMQYVIVGKANRTDKVMVRDKFSKCSNIEIVFLGDLVPIPRALFKKIDVVLAGSGCAILSALEGVPTILADAKTNKSDGLLGYDTTDFLFVDETRQTTFEESLQKCLIEKSYVGKEFRYKREKTNDYYYEQHFHFFVNKLLKQEYYKSNKLIYPKEYISKSFLKYHLHKMLNHD